MIAVRPIAARLEAAGCVRVQGVLEYAALEAPPPQLPAFFVLPAEETAAPSRLAGIVDQKVTARFQVVIVVAAIQRRTGAPAEQLETEVERVVRALVGWTHPEGSGCIEYDGGRLLSVAGHAAAWSARFRTAHHLRVTPG